MHSLLSARSLIGGSSGGESTCFLNRSNDGWVVLPQEVSSNTNIPSIRASLQLSTACSSWPLTHGPLQLLLKHSSLPLCYPHSSYAQLLASSQSPLGLAFVCFILFSWSILFSSYSPHSSTCLTYLLGHNSYHPFSEPHPTSFSVWTERPSTVPPQPLKLTSVKGTQSTLLLSSVYFLVHPTRCHVPKGERPCLSTCSPCIALSIW